MDLADRCGGPLVGDLTAAQMGLVRGLVSRTPPHERPAENPTENRNEGLQPGAAAAFCRRVLRSGSRVQDLGVVRRCSAFRATCCIGDSSVGRAWQAATAWRIALDSPTGSTGGLVVKVNAGISRLATS